MVDYLNDDDAVKPERQLRFETWRRKYLESTLSISFCFYIPRAYITDDTSYISLRLTEQARKEETICDWK